MIKKLTAVLLMSIMVLSGTVMSFASETNRESQLESENVTPFALACDCGGALNQKISYTSWGQVGQVICSHGIVGRTDVTWQREKVVKTTCSKCNLNRTDLYPEQTIRCGTARP